MRHSSIDEEKNVLLPLGVEIDTTYSETELDLIRNGEGAVGFLVSYARITRRVMESLPELKIISKYGVGVENVDLDAATELGIYVTNVPNYCVEEVALHTLSLILAGLRKVCYFGNELRKRNWITNPETETIWRLSRVDLGLIGFGRIGRKVSSYMENMVRNVYYYDPYVDEVGGKSGKHLAVKSIEELFRKANIVSIHVPLTSDTSGMIGCNILSQAQGIILVNTSRADIIDREALREALDSKRVIFYASDVFWEEPPDFENKSQLSFLLRKDVLVTPHFGWYSEESERNVRRRAAEEVARVIKGHEPKNLVNRHLEF